MKYLTHEQTYERIKKIVNGVTEELETLRSINDLNDSIEGPLDELEEEIRDSFDDELIKEILYSAREESTEIDKELEEWTEDFSNQKGQTLGLDEGQIVGYLNFIKDRDKKEEAVTLLRNIIEGPEIERYRNLKAFFDFLQQELEEDTESAQEILQIKQRELLYLIIDNTINIDATDIFYLANNTQVDTKQHALYLGFESASEDISPDDFESFYREIMEQITNPYTKLGMNLLYLSKIEDYIMNDPNYKPSADLINEAMPYLALKVSLDEVETSSMMAGAFSEAFLEKCNIWDGIYFINFYNQVVDMDRGLYDAILKNADELNPIYVKLIKNLSQGRTEDTIDVILNDIFGDFIKNQMQEQKDGKMTEPEFIALILQSLEISLENLANNIQNIHEMVRDKEFLSKDDLIKISSLMFYLEGTENLSQDMRNMLREASTKWINAYIDNSDTKQLRATIESICEEAMQLDEIKAKKNLTDEEIEQEMFGTAQDFYKEFVAAYILRNLSEKAEAEIYKYEQKLQKKGIDKEKYLEVLKYAYSSPQIFDENMKLFNQDTQKWIRSIISLNPDESKRDIDCNYIIPLIFSMKNPESIKQAVEILYNIMEGDEEEIYRKSAELIELLQKEVAEEESTLSSAEFAGKKLLLLNIMFLLPEDLKYIDDNENSYFHTLLRPDTEIKDHGKYFALGSIMENMSPEQFEKFYNAIYTEISSDNVKAGLDMYYIYNIENYMFSDEKFSPDIRKIETKLPIILAGNYMSREAKMQMYQYGAFTSSFKDDIPSSVDTIVTANYLTRCEINDDLYSIIANRCDVNEVSKDTIGALKGLGVLKGRGENGEFYKKYIKMFCGDFIEDQRTNLLPPDPAAEDEIDLTEGEKNVKSQDGKIKQSDASTTSLSKAYMAMLLNTSIYDTFNESSIQALKNLNESFKAERTSSSNLFDIGSYLMFIEKSILVDGQFKVSKILSELGENWMECYLDGGKIPKKMRENLAILLNTLEKEFSYEER